jgi:hypothetical protein
VQRQRQRLRGGGGVQSDGAGEVGDGIRVARGLCAGRRADAAGGEVAHTGGRANPV